MGTLAQPSFLRTFNNFLYKPAYFFLIGALTVIANIFGAELFTYTCFVLIFLYLCFWGRDLLPVLPMAICAYIAPSRGNNPGLSDESIFSPENGGSYIIFLAFLLVVGVICRLIRDKALGRAAFWKCRRQLLPGLLVLFLAYLLSGIGSSQWEKVSTQNLLFAFIQGVSILLPYFLLTALVKWEEAPKAYLAWTGMCVGFVLLAELANIYVQFDVIEEGIINRRLIYSGWGHYNNIGALLAMMIPFPFFLTGKGKHTSIFYIVGLLFLAGIIFTCSRGSILFGVLTYGASYIASLIHSRNARSNWVIHVCTLALAIAVYIFFYDRMLNLFQMMIEQQWDSAGRITGYIEGWKQFTQFPIFGGTFYPIDYDLYTWSTSAEFVAFFPPRWHNTFVQILASCGVVGFVAYLFHRLQTATLFLRHFSTKKLFPLISMLTLLGTSLLDCHFFNVGPVLFYSMMLAFVEKQSE